MQQCIDMNMERVEYPQEVEEEEGASTEEEEKEKTGKIQIGIELGKTHTQGKYRVFDVLF